MSAARFLVGDVFDRLAEIPDGSVDLVLTSPPFLALRSYLPADHPDKGKEIGQEPTPAEFIDTLLALSAEWRRVLAPHGSICVELGDTYSSTGGITDNREDSLGGNDFAPRGARGGGDGWPLAKSMTGIPHLYHLSLAYGRNLLTGERSPAGMWRIRNVVAWCRPNPPVGALGDKFRPATSYMTVACVSGSRYFDLDAVRTPHQHGEAVARGSYSHGDTGNRRAGGDDAYGDTVRDIALNPAGAPPLDYWVIPTQPYAGSHYATFPEALCVRPIEAMCPRRVCLECGQPSRRIVESERVVVYPQKASTAARSNDPGFGEEGHTTRTTLGWTDCGHNAWRPGHVLDPFAGSGTTLAVATARGRDATGIDIDARNLDLARQRIGMWLEEAP